MMLSLLRCDRMSMPSSTTCRPGANARDARMSGGWQRHACCSPGLPAWGAGSHLRSHVLEEVKLPAAGRAEGGLSTAPRLQSGTPAPAAAFAAREGTGRGAPQGSGQQDSRAVIGQELSGLGIESVGGVLLEEQEEAARHAEQALRQLEARAGRGHRAKQPLAQAAALAAALRPHRRRWPVCAPTRLEDVAALHGPLVRPVPVPDVVVCTAWHRVAWHSRAGGQAGWPAHACLRTALRWPCRPGPSPRPSRSPSSPAPRRTIPHHHARDLSVRQVDVGARKRVCIHACRICGCGERSGAAGGSCGGRDS